MKNSLTQEQHETLNMQDLYNLICKQNELISTLGKYIQILADAQIKFTNEIIEIKRDLLAVERTE